MLTLNKIVGLALLPLVFVFSSIAASTAQNTAQPGDPAVQEFDVPLVAYAIRAYDLTPSATVVEDTLPVDGGNTVTFGFGSTSKTLAITLTSPTGQTFSTTNGDALISPDPPDPDVIGASYLFIIEQPEVGDWSYRIEETGTLTTTRAVFLEAHFASPVRAAIVSADPRVRQDRTVTLGLVVAEGTALRTAGLTIDARLNRLDGSAPPVPVTFRDDGTDGDRTAGDGLFTASFRPDALGAYGVEAVITGTTSQGNPFLRMASTTFEVTPVHATLTGSFTDRGIDDDGDGLFDRIGIAPGLDVTAAGDYLVTVVLKASNDTTLAANVTTALTTSSASAEVFFRADDIRRELGVDGPYRVSLVIVEHITSSAVVVADERTNLGDTAGYTLTQLERDPITIVSDGTAVGVDTNGNGKFEFLDIDLPVNFQYNGSYQWSASLVDSAGVTIVAAGNQDAFDSGAATLTLRFDGTAIAQNGVDGPYFVRSLLIYGSGQAARSDEVLTTQDFAYTDFESGTVAPTSTPTPIPARVRPILDCVYNNGDGTFTAFFGYSNPNTFAVDIPIGADNRFTPDPIDRGQPSRFEPGRTPWGQGFNVTWNGQGNLVWTLQNRTSTASSTDLNQRCSRNPLATPEAQSGQ